ncbi:UNVERIFIED_CONTAM: Dual specificity tyrosine-phosphorylation-regulated kinase, partial [Siphonaria sp. JEL0065]
STTELLQSQQSLAATLDRLQGERDRERERSSVYVHHANVSNAITGTNNSGDQPTASASGTTYTAPAPASGEGKPRRLSVGASILKSNKHLSSDLSPVFAATAKNASASGAKASSALSNALSNGSNVRQSLSLEKPQNPSMQRSATAANPGVRRSVALNIPSSSSANSGALSAGLAIHNPTPPAAQPLAHRLSLHSSRSLTTGNSAQLPTPAPNHFYQQQQQMRDPNYRLPPPHSQIPQSPLTPVSNFNLPNSPAPTQPLPAPPQQPQQQPTPNPTPTPQQPSLKLPLSPETTLQFYRDLLTDYEAREVFQYPHIYFAGAMGVDKIGTARRRTGSVGVPQESLTKEDLTGVFNNGYDDSRGDYYWTAHDHIGYRYECISLLGKGSFGQCLKCFDHKTKTIVALKIIRNKKRFEKQGVVEVKVLDRLRKEDSDMSHNLVHMQDSFYFRGHLCITFELLGINLYEWVKSGGFRGIHMGVLKRFSVQILQCLQLLYRIKSIHCDLKPENILLCDPSYIQPQKCDLVPSSSTGLPRSFIDPEFNQHSPVYDIKVIDFGSACFEHEKVYTYIQSRFYRSPEVILGTSYTNAIDMWSVGCIIAELFTGYPLFPGENEQHQLACIMEIKGVPPEYIIERGSRRKLFFEHGQPRSFTDSKGRKRRPATKSLTQVLRTTDVMFLDFLERCLEWDPDRRMKPDEALRHEWLAGFAPPPPTPSPVPFSSTSSGIHNPHGGDRTKMTSPSTSSHSTKYSFGEMMSNAASSIVNRSRALSNAQSPSTGSTVSNDIRYKKTASIAVTDPSALSATQAAVNGGEPSSWKSSFSNWRRMGSISGPSGKKTSELNLRKDGSGSGELPAIPAASVPSMVPRSSQPSLLSQNVRIVTEQQQQQQHQYQQYPSVEAEPAVSAVLGPATADSTVGLSPLLAVPPHLSPTAINDDFPKTPVENVVLDVLVARNTPGGTSLASKKSNEKDGVNMSRSSSFSSKFGGLVRSLSQKKKK